MPRLCYTSDAIASMANISDYIFQTSGELAARRFASELDAKCRALSQLPGTLGRARPELRRNLRSYAFRNHIIFFRYVEDTFEVVDILHGHRDIDGFFQDA